MAMTEEQKAASKRAIEEAFRPLREKVERGEVCAPLRMTGLLGPRPIEESPLLKKRDRPLSDREEAVEWLRWMMRREPLPEEIDEYVASKELHRAEQEAEIAKARHMDAMDQINKSLEDDLRNPSMFEF